MQNHKTELTCPRCEGLLALTTEWGWVNDETCTAVLCCPDCRIELGFAERAVVGHDAATEEEALAGCLAQADDLLATMQQAASEEAMS